MKTPSHPKPEKAGTSVSAKKNATTSLPPRPYTEYNIFFRIERARMLQSMGVIDAGSLDRTHQYEYDPLEFPRPAGYESVSMPPYWYSRSRSASTKKKRKHRKVDGGMDLKTMSRAVSASWKDVGEAVMGYCRRLAEAEMEEYNAQFKSPGKPSKPARLILDGALHHIEDHAVDGGSAPKNLDATPPESPKKPFQAPLASRHRLVQIQITNSTPPTPTLTRADSQQAPGGCSEARSPSSYHSSDSGVGVGVGVGLSLQEDYDTVIECLIQQLEYKDERMASMEEKVREQLAAKDGLIESLMGKLARMSLELASTKARRDELRHRLDASVLTSSSTASASLGGSSLNVMLLLNERALYGPVYSNDNRGNNERHNCWGTSLGMGTADTYDYATTLAPPSDAGRASCSSVRTSFASEAKSSFNNSSSSSLDNYGTIRPTAYDQLLGLQGRSRQRGLGNQDGGGTQVYSPPTSIYGHERRVDEEANAAAAAAQWYLPHAKRRQAEAAALPRKVSRKDLKFQTPAQEALMPRNRFSP